MSSVPLGRFMGQNPLGGHSMGNPMGNNPMGIGMGFPRQNLFRQILSAPGVQNQIPNFMRRLQNFLGTTQPYGQGGTFQPFGQGGNPQLFGQGGSAGSLGPGAPLGQMGQSGPGSFQPFGQGQTKLFGLQNFGLQNQGINVPSMGSQNPVMPRNIQPGYFPPSTGGNLNEALSVQTPPGSPQFLAQPQAQTQPQFQPRPQAQSQSQLQPQPQPQSQLQSAPAKSGGFIQNLLSRLGIGR